MKVLTGSDIRRMQKVLEGEGIECVVVPGKDNSALVALNWKAFGDNGLEAAFSLIRDAIHGVKIRFVSSRSRVSASVIVSGC